METKLPGIEPLDCFYRWLLSTLGVDFNSYLPRHHIWINKKLQPETEKHRRIKPQEADLEECPHYKVIELCAEFVGIFPTKLAGFDFFCGALKRDIVSGNSVGARVIGKIQIPFCCCERLRDVLAALLCEVKNHERETSKDILDLWTAKMISKFPKSKMNPELIDVISFVEAILKTIEDIGIPCNQAPRFELIQTKLE